MTHHRPDGGMPIIFSAPMVRAILDGRKTQTRRILKPQPEQAPNGTWHVRNAHGGCIGVEETDIGRVAVDYLPYQPGQLLWVRENWTYINHQHGSRGFEVCIGYNADGDNLPNRPFIVVDEEWSDKVDSWPFKRRRWPSIHMPRWASRLTLEVTSVKVERLQEISEDDAAAEGIELDVWDQAPAARNYGKPDGWFCMWGAPEFYTEPDVYVPFERLCRTSFKTLWESIHGLGSWDQNPWVSCVTFKPHRCNIDSFPHHSEE